MYFYDKISQDRKDQGGRETLQSQSGAVDVSADYFGM